MHKSNNGYIKLSRNILKWRWSANPNTFTVFIHLLMMANYKYGEFEMSKLERGSLATSLRNLGITCGLSIDQVRTALSHLKQTGEITITRRSRYLEITIVNYIEYQDVPTEIPDKSQSNPNQIPRKSQQEKESKKERNKEGNIGRSAPSSPLGRNGIPKLRDEGTVDDIPEMYRDMFDNYQDYFDFRS